MKTLKSEKLRTEDKMEQKLFQVTGIEGKGLGCVAQKDIKRGTLILMEKPCLLQNANLKILDKEYFDDAFQSYEKMDNKQKDQFFKLANNYKQIEETNIYPDDKMNVFLEYLKENPKLYSESVALEVIQVTETNYIKRGTLVLMEKPCLLQNSNLKILDKDYFDDAFQAYEGMDIDQKEQFFKLANNYKHIKETNLYPDDKMKVLLEYLKENPKLYSESVALKVIQVTETNTFNNGVCLELSRFNHSCVSNAEHCWNEDVKTRDVRAIRYTIQNILFVFINITLKDSEMYNLFSLNDFWPKNVSDFESYLGNIAIMNSY